MNVEAIEAQFKREGYDEVVRVDWEAGKAFDTHTHEFSAAVYVLSGEMTITTEDGEHTYRSGDRCTVNAEVPHAERVGPDGASFLVGRRHAATAGGHRE